MTMSEEQLKAFIAKVKGDSSLQEKLKATKSPEEVVGIAREHGFEFTADKIAELGEEELEGMVGGLMKDTHKRTGGFGSHCGAGCCW